MKSQKVKLILVLNLITLSGIMGLSHLISTNIGNESASPNHVIYSINSIQATDPIWVVGNPDFKTQAHDLGWDLGGSLDGSASHPFLISGNTISDTGTLIYIRDTTYHFELKTNAVKGGNTGIYLWNVSNGKIFENIIFDCAVTAIYVRECPGPLLISDNTITNITDFGIHLSSSNLTEVSINTVNANGTGIYLSGTNQFGPCINNSILNNRITNSPGGISLWGANNNTVDSNELINTSSGITLGEDDNAFPARPRIHNNTIINNTIENTVSDGINLDYSMNNLLVNNSVFNAGGSGIELYDSRDNKLIGNNFTDSGSGYGVRLQFTNGTTMIDNTLENGTFVLLFGIGLDPSLYYQGEIHGNWVNGKPLVFWQNVNGGTVPTNAGQVFIVNCTDIEIANLNLRDVPNSIVVAVSSRLNIHDNSIYNCMLALEIDTLMDSVISSNVINDTDGSGINIKTGKDLIISDNMIYNCGGGSSTGGIFLKNVDDSVIVDNTIQDVSVYGISLDSSLNNTIYQNNFSVHSLTTPLSYGMNMYFADDNWVVNNTFYNFTNNGIRFYYADNNSILSNTIKNTTGYGIYVRSSNDVTFKFNSLIDNNEGSVQAYDDGTTNVFKYNYWNDLTGPDDSPPDGFVDSNYTIDGGPKNNDTFALTVPYSVTPPIFISPTGGETLKENVSVQWTAASDTLGYSFTYDLYYSTNGGTSWVLLTTDLDTMAFEWDTLELSNSTMYLLKVIARNSEGFFAEDISNAVFTVQNVAHRLLPPIITSPLGGETIDGIVNIQWSASTDSWNHSYQVTYDLYYSADGGTSWTSLGTVSSPFLWNTSDVSDGSNYLLKVEASNTEGLTSEFITDPAITIQNHILSNPTIVTPNGGEVLEGTVDIQWTVSTDTESHTVTYSVYYSVTGGTSWIELDSDLTVTTMPWDTTTVSDGTNYLIKVVSICSGGLTAEDASDTTFTIQNIIPTTPTTTGPEETTSETPSPTTTETSTPPAGSTPGWTGFSLLLILGGISLIRRKKTRKLD